MTALTPIDFIRYSRQLNLPGFNEQNQLALQESKVLVVGAGGLGSAVIMYLAAAGVGELGIVDFDQVELHNLHRQVLYTSEDIGKYKVDLARARVKAINKEIVCRTYKEALTSLNAEAILSQYDVVADGTDNFSTRYLVNDCCVKLGKPNVFASILRFEGQLSVFNLRDASGDYGPNYRDIFLHPPEASLIPNCAEGGILGPVAGVLACYQANEVLKLASGMGTRLSGRIMCLDLLNMESRTIKIKKDPDNHIRYENRDKIELIELESVCEAKGSLDYGRIYSAELKKELDCGDSILVVDIRSKSEFDAGNIGALNIPGDKILNDPSILPETSKIVLHCLSGKRSDQLIQQLKSAGSKKPLYNLEGGMQAWIQRFGQIKIS